MKRNTPTEDYEFTVNADEFYGYEVRLPHQCDSWKIIGRDYKQQFNREVAIQQMELFVKRAQEALEELKKTPLTIERED